MQTGYSASTRRCHCPWKPCVVGMTGTKVLNRSWGVTGVGQGLSLPLEGFPGRCWLGEGSQGPISIQCNGHDKRTGARWPGFTV